jgi:hypothetical protein
LKVLKKEQEMGRGELVNGEWEKYNRPFFAPLFTIHDFTIHPPKMLYNKSLQASIGAALKKKVMLFHVEQTRKSRETVEAANRDRGISIRTPLHNFLLPAAFSQRQLNLHPYRSK